ncbi:MAG: bacteriohemerythrin [Burkholderiales bacterium]|nr:bacteriohemerythrin [Burkholderiales bacterium]
MELVEIFPWNENFVTGIASIDEQHRGLIGLLNTLVAHLAFQAEAPELERIFDELRAYTVGHFKSEEQLWSRVFHGDPWEVWHHQAHVDFIDKVKEIHARDGGADRDRVIEEIVTFLTHWLALHIIESDKRMAKVVLALPSGVSFERAKAMANEEMTGATRVLIDTVMGMYDKLANRTVALTREINRRARAEAELRAAQAEMARLRDEAVAASQAKSAFLANMSHEIRTPLTAILGMSRLALETPLDARQRHYLGSVQKAAQALLGMINDVLDHTRVEAGGLILERVEFGLAELLDTLTGVTALAAQGQGLELVLRIDPALPRTLRGDPLRLGQILLNLVGNAIKFTAAGEVVVAVERGAQDARVLELHFTISDTGIGMSAEQVERLFVPFSQADASTSRRYGGSGLGLSIARCLAEMMDGRIEVESVPGRGSVFRCSLRLEAGAAPARAGAGAWSGRCGLVVDRNASVRSALRAMLEALAIDVVEAADPARALACARARAAGGLPLDVVLLDARLPGLCATGAQGRRVLAGMARELPVILMSGADGHGADVPAQADPAALGPLLYKPVVPWALEDALARALGPAGAGGEPGQRPPAGDDTMRALQGLRVLVADDVATNRELIAALLERVGIEVEQARDGAAALAAAQARHFDLILMDLHMPGMNGAEAARRIRAAGPCRATPILAVTAGGCGDDARDGGAGGMNGLVHKPVDPDALYRALARATGLRIEPQPAPAGLPAQAGAPEAAALQGRLAALAGLDLKRGLEIVRGDVGRYAELLQGLLAEHGDEPRRIERSLREGRPTDALHHAHRLRGLAGMLGLVGVEAAAAALESQLRADEGRDGLDLQPLRQGLGELARGLAPTRDGDPEAAHPAGVPAPIASDGGAGAQPSLDRCSDR